MDLLLTEQRLEHNEFLREVLVRYQSLTRFSSAVFMPVAPDSWEMQRGLSFALDDAQMAEYLDFFAPLDPMVRNGPTPTSVNQVFRFSDVAAGLGGWQGAFAEFMDRVPYRHALAALVATPAGPLGAFAIHRTSREPDFDESEKRLFGRIVGCMAKGALWRQYSQQEARRPTATLLIAESDKVLWMNETAEGLAGALRLDPPQLCRLATQSARLETDTGSFLVRADALTRNSLYLRWALGACSTAFLAVKGSDLARMLGAIRLVTLAPLPVRGDTTAAFAEMGLTPAETRVAGGIIGGLAIKQIARDLGIEQGTVKKHATHIYQKAHVRSRADLTASVTGVKSNACMERRH